jgi:hypothetical protein
MKVRLKIYTLALLFAFFAPTALLSQDVAGDWQGTLSAGPNSLRVVFHFTCRI